MGPSPSVVAQASPLVHSLQVLLPTVGPHGLAGFHRSWHYYIYCLFALMPRILAHARTIDQAVAAENPTVAAKPLKNYWKYFGILFIIILSQSVNFRVINAFIPIFWTRELGTSPEQGSFALTVFFSIGIFMTIHWRFIR